MKSNDKINQFFVQRLGDDTPGDDGWNMPSDDIFESAKVHFPEKKKKKRPFFLWFGTGVFAVGILALIYLGFSKNIQEINTAQSIVQTTIETNSSNNKSASDNVIEIINNNINTNTKSENSNNDSKIAKEPLTVNKSAIIKEKVVDVIVKSINQWATPKTEVITPTIETTNSEVSQVKTSTIAAISNTIATNTANISKLTNNSNSKINNAIPFLLKKDKLAVVQPISINESDGDLPLEQLELPTIRKFQKWEIGLTHARFMLPFNALTLTDGAEQISFDAKNVNINIPITRRFNRKWSMTSGYSYTDLDLDLVLREELIYNQNATEDKIESKLDEIITKGVIAGRVELNDQSRDINLEFIENLELMDGDILTLNAVVPLRLNVHQMPILVNYHLGNKKWEWILHAGTALEYFSVSIPFLQMDAMNENTILTNPVEFESISTRAFTYAIIAGGGLKYHLTDHFNIGLNTKIDVTGIPFARYEFGLFYGFTPKKNNKSMMQY